MHPTELFAPPHPTRVIKVDSCVNHADLHPANKQARSNTQTFTLQISKQGANTHKAMLTTVEPLRAHGGRVWQAGRQAGTERVETARTCCLQWWCPRLMELRRPACLPGCWSKMGRLVWQLHGRGTLVPHHSLVVVDSRRQWQTINSYRYDMIHIATVI